MSLPEPGTWAWRWIFIKHYIYAFFYYLILGMYLVCMYPRASWQYLKRLFTFTPKSIDQAKQAIDAAWEAWWDKMFGDKR